MSQPLNFQDILRFMIHEVAFSTTTSFSDCRTFTFQMYFSYTFLFRHSSKKLLRVGKEDSWPGLWVTLSIAARGPHSTLIALSFANMLLMFNSKQILQLYPLQSSIQTKLLTTKQVLPMQLDSSSKSVKISLHFLDCIILVHLFVRKNAIEKYSVFFITEISIQRLLHPSARFLNISKMPPSVLQNNKWERFHFPFGLVYSLFRILSLRFIHRTIGLSIHTPY